MFQKGWSEVRERKRKSKECDEIPLLHVFICSTRVCLVLTSCDSLLMWLSDLNKRNGSFVSPRSDRSTDPQRVCRELPNLLLILRQGSGSREQRQSADDCRPTGHGGTNT